jgi:hypothetical protein
MPSVFWQWIWSWESGIPAITIGLICLGGWFLTMTPPEFLLPKIVFSLAAVWLFVRSAYLVSVELSNVSAMERIIVASVIGTLISGLWAGSILWIHDRELKAAEAILDVGKIKVFLGRAHWLDFPYLGANQDSQDKILDPVSPIKVLVNKENPFVFGIANLNSGIPVEDARLQIFFKRSDNLQVRPGLDGQPEERLWRVHETNVQYWYPFKAVHDEWLHSWNALYVTFPRAGKYSLTFEITGKAFPKITTVATVEAVEPITTRSNPGIQGSSN